MDIATRLGVTKGSVSLALRQLAQRRLLRADPAGFPVLTAAGSRVARDVRGRFAIVEAFLTDVLGVPARQAATEACRWEHVISHEVADRMLDLLRFGREDSTLSRALSAFRQFHRSCSPGARCSTCAAHEPVEAFCPERALIELPPHGPPPAP